MFKLSLLTFLDETKSTIIVYNFILYYPSSYQPKQLFIEIHLSHHFYDRNFIHWKHKKRSSHLEFILFSIHTIPYSQSKMTT